ncbi:Hpt domain-containing protein [Bremerella sp. JC817]|uniref:Hpt domain-containing protein n=1 Tax=Bremerella sp. JC817 TaxID=3231756 RepID=UPI003459448C
MNWQPMLTFSTDQSINWETLTSRCIGRIDLVEKALDRFQQALVGDLEALEAAADEQNSEEVARIAHRIKGTSLTVSADRLAEIATKLEQKAEGSLQNVDESLSDIREEYDRLTDIISQRRVGDRQ